MIALIVLRSESPSGKCAKLRTVAASNNAYHPTSPLARTINGSPALEVSHQVHSIGITLLLLVRATYIWVGLRAHSVRGEPRIQRNANREVATIALMTIRRFF